MERTPSFTYQKSIHTENWETARFLSEEFQVFINLSGLPVPKIDSPDQIEVELRYCVTLADKDFNEIMQKSFSKLEDAITLINKNYGTWELSEVAETKSSDGCSSCAAH